MLETPSSPKDLYMVLSLPKGYKMVLLNNLNNTRINNVQYGSINKTVYETNNQYNYDNYLAKSPTMGTTNSDTEEYVIERTSLQESDMGNQIYFRVVHNHTSLFLLTIKSFEVYFTAEGTFSEEVAPEAQGPLTSCVASPFKTIPTTMAQEQETGAKVMSHPVISNLSMAVATMACMTQNIVLMHPIIK